MASNTLSASGRILARSAALSSARPPPSSCPYSAGACRSAATATTCRSIADASSACTSAATSSSTAFSTALTRAALTTAAASARIEARTASSLLTSGGGPTCGIGASRQQSSTSAGAGAAATTRLPPPSAFSVDFSPAEVVTAALLAISAAGMFVATAGATAANEGVGFAGPAPFAGVGAKLTKGGGGGGSIGGTGGPSAGGGMSALTVRGAGEIVEEKQKEDDRAIGEFDVAGKMVRLLGNSAVASDWMGASVPRSRATVDPYIPKAYDVSIRALKGGRLSMEDEYFVANGGRFVAVFDGHGGGGVSQYLREKLYEVFGRHLRESEDGCVDDVSLLSQGASKDRLAAATSARACSITSRVAAMRAAFDEVERDVCRNDDLQYQGSTAVAVVLHEDPDGGSRTLVSANVGDSRAILSRRGRAVDLTRDHKPNDEKEKSRILAMGETIEWDHYCKVHRVRNLSLSRAIGDRFAKPAVSSEVEIKRFPVAEDGDEFILLASDGLWDVMSSQEVVSFVNKKLGKPKDCDDSERIRYSRRKNMSRLVANEAIRRGTGDNVCVVIVWLQDSHFDGTSQ